MGKKFSQSGYQRQTILAPPSLSPTTTRYHRRLVDQAGQLEDGQERIEYLLACDQEVVIGNQAVKLFAPYHADVSASTVITKVQKKALLLCLCGAVLLIAFLHVEAFMLAIAVVTSLYVAQCCMALRYIAQTLFMSSEIPVDPTTIAELAHSPWPAYTILCPLYHEAAIVPQFVKAMCALDYPPDRLQILLLTEEDDQETRGALAALEELPAHFRVITVPAGIPRTKARACNYGLLHARICSDL
jgi:hypothetical protein